MGFPYHLSHHHVYELAGHQLQSASAVPFSIDGLLNGSCAASVGNSNPLLSSGCGMNGDNQQYKLTGKPHYIAHNNLPSMLACCTETKKTKNRKKQRQDVAIQVVFFIACLKGEQNLAHRHRFIFFAPRLHFIHRKLKMHPRKTMFLSVSNHWSRGMPVLVF